MLTVAEKWFGFSRGEKLTVHIADGVSFINNCITGNKRGRKFMCHYLSWFYRAVLVCILFYMVLDHEIRDIIGFYVMHTT